MLINRINLQSPIRQYNNRQNNNVSFGMNPQKQLVELLASENLGKFKITFDEAKKMCEMLGHSVETPRGSHAKIHIKDHKGILPLVIPHGSESNLSILDKKKLIYLFTGRYSDAFRMR